MCKIKNKNSTTTTNPKLRDKRYLRNEHSLHRAINSVALDKRRVGVKTKEVCNAANFSSPTLYAHCHSIDEALSNYESQIITDFTELLRKDHLNHEVIFIILLNFIRQYRTYFAATLKNHNSWLLAQLIANLRPHLVSKNINDKCYDLYTGSITTLIFCWYKHEKFNTDKIPLYTKKLLQIRIINIGI